MRTNQSSLTAYSTAAERAIEMERPTDERICSDSLAREFLPNWFYAFMKWLSATRFAERRAAGALGFIVARCRFMDDVLIDALDQGIQQLVILGAGFDSRAYRFNRLKNRVKVFEVDHPATQKAKIRKLQSTLGAGCLPTFVTFVPVDFTHESLAVRLAECGYSERLKTLFIWEGVTMYLDAVSVEGTLAFIASHSAPGSTVVFDYMCAQPALPKLDVRIWLVKFLRRSLDEVRRFKIEMGQIEPFLARLGFGKIRNMTAADLHARYFTGKNAGREVTPDYAIAVGTI